MRAHAGARIAAKQGAATSPASSHLHARPFAGRAAGGSAGRGSAPAPATHDLASISIQPPAGAPLQRVSWWKRAKDAGSALWNAAPDRGTVAKTAVSGGLGAAGALAYGGAAALTASTLGAAALAGGAAYGLYRGVDYLMSPRAAPEEAHLTLPSRRLVDRPDKPDALKGKDETGADLTGHHKIPFNQLRDTINDAAGHSWSSLIPGRQATARANLARWSAREDGSDVGARGVTWTPHNIFMGPPPERRPDDPQEHLDTHFTPSGTVTPRSELALDVTHGGGLSRFDPDELHRRLQALADKRNQASGYDRGDWRGSHDELRQRGQPPGWETMTTAEKREYIADRRAEKRAAKAAKKAKARGKTKRK
jgi:hypothetical protein